MTGVEQRANVRQHIHPRAIGQVVIGEDQIEGRQVMLERFAAALDADDGASTKAVFDLLADQLALVRVVFDDEQTELLAFHVHASHNCDLRYIGQLGQRPYRTARIIVRYRRHDSAGT